MIREQVELQDYNTLRAPAVADHFAELSAPEELRALLLEARERDWPITVLGEGSNVVLADRLPGLTLLQRSKGIRVLSESASRVRLEVTAGENWHGFVGWCLQRGYFGLENLALIPGTVGAAPIQNIGAYGVEVGPFIESVATRELPSGKALLLDQDACEFGYRDSVFKHDLRDSVLVESVTFDLPKTADPVIDYPSLQSALAESGVDMPTPRDVFDAVVAIRSARLPDPKAIPNAGSFFKNPVLSAAAAERFLATHRGAPHFEAGEAVKVPAAWLIDQCGYKQQEGAVRVHAEHALVIVNPEGRPASEIHALAAHIVDNVAHRFGILLEQEPRNYGIDEA